MGKYAFTYLSICVNAHLLKDVDSFKPPNFSFSQQAGEAGRVGWGFAPERVKRSPQSSFTLRVSCRPGDAPRFPFCCCAAVTRSPPYVHFGRLRLLHFLAGRQG